MKTKTGRRVLLKLSGEAFSEPGQPGVDGARLKRVAEQIVSARTQGVEIAIVVGGGNFLRGSKVQNSPVTRMTLDHMGMLATVMNGLALHDAILASGGEAVVLSAFPILGLASLSNTHRVRETFARGAVAIFVGGTGNAFVTTDTAASLRAIEIGANVLLKATKVDGVYDADPFKNPHAKKWEQLTFDEVIERRLEVMDIAAFTQCREFHIPIRVFNMSQPDALTRALLGEPLGTLIG